MKLKPSLLRIAAALIAAALPAAAASQLTVEASNPLAAARPDQVIELTLTQLAPLGETNLTKIHVRDSAGNPVLCQAVDNDFDPFHRPDSVIFLANFAPSEKKTFTVVVGQKQVYRLEQFRAHGRFVRERFDDFAWENDLIAHRMYGKGLETWAGEPLTSSTVDIWSKRTPAMVIDQWYMVDDYHADSGQGADFYSAGPSRGCGGNGLWAADKLWVSRNFVESRVLANGPIRVMFELVYEPFEVNGRKFSEVKLITLDAGSQLDHFQSTYIAADGASPGTLLSGVGLKKNAGQEKASSPEKGYLALWEKVAKNQGLQGLGLVFDPASLDRFTEDRLNQLALLKAGPDAKVSYWAGFCWDKAGRITTLKDWEAYLQQFAAKLARPIEIKIK